MSEELIINTYLAEKKPGYALQITGEWGVGKTYTIKKILNDNMYYISLFDMKSADEIYSSIFYLMQKNKERTKKFILNIKKIDLSLFGLKLPLGELFSSLSNAIVRSEVINDKAIVFDDIERCTLSSDIIFGVISNYIENHNCHVIILMNESKKEKINNYDELSEKTIGRKIKVLPNFSEAYDDFIRTSANKDLLLTAKENILNIFKKSECNSLRVLKRVIFEIDAICRCIDFNKHNNIIHKIYEGLYVFIILSINAKLGNIDTINIRNRKNAYNYKLKKLFPNSNSESEANDNLFYNLNKNYSDEFDLSTIIFNDDVVFNAIFNGVYNYTDIEKSICSYEKINSENKEVPWKTIYKYIQYSDDEINAAVSKIQLIIDKREYYPLPHRSWLIVLSANNCACKSSTRSLYCFNIAASFINTLGKKPESFSIG